MKANFKPQIFTVSFDGFNGLTQFDLLTLDGLYPDETVYFFEKGTAPSSCEQKRIDDAVEDGEYDRILEATLEDTDRFHINQPFYDADGNSYLDISALHD